MDTASGNEIHDISLNYVAQQPFVPKSFIQKMIAFFTQTTVIYMHPDVKVIQEGEILRVLVNKDSEGQSNIEITIPSNARTENHVNTQNRIFNHNSDLELGNQACFTKKDYPNFETSKIPPRLDNTYIDTGNDYSNEGYNIVLDVLFMSLNIVSSCLLIMSCRAKLNIKSNHEKSGVDDQPDESKTLYHRGFPVELVSYSTRKFHLNDKSSFLESVTFRKENRSRQRETLIIFHLKGMLYSPSALMHLDMEDIEITNSIDILCISETERELRVEVLTGLNRYTAFEFAKLLQFLHNGQRVRKLKDLIPCLKLGDPKKDDPVFLERVKTENEGYIKTCFSLNQDLYGNHSQTSKNKDIEDTIAENIKKLQQEMSKVQQDLDLNMGATNGKIVGKNANAKCFTDSKWTDRKQMGNIKVRTQSDRPTWTICLQNPEDETEGVVSGYLGDPMISQAIYEFFGQYIDCGYTGSIERPPIPWPSMHPLLPYKCKYLDNRGS